MKSDGWLGERSLPGVDAGERPGLLLATADGCWLDVVRLRLRHPRPHLLPAAIASHDPIVIVAWVAQTFLQLILLPITIVGQNIQAAATDARAESDHATLMAIHMLTSEVHDIATKQTAILKFLEERSGGVAGPS